ncbi:MULTISPECIES: histidine-type phosphatase [Sphingomonas]|jgi:4-phytase/acid phosphatase|uniref:histidine-type phosphatase n=1 Tax=Sphingomonas TaxID=13687 RepID=UPI000DBC22DD|nr:MULTISPECIES: histidine-type phosphatase [Sphingomonas]PZT91131.1 MAG: histidine-type phosphatase [Sphingomonas sp.]RSV24867.1 histidine-type phosphatase [Sphingomonas sp. ABOLH]WCP71809.1 histidine-type phosphatase [Sphingomonas hankookensis]
MRLLLLAATLLTPLPAAAQDRVERVVMLMRHGVRAPITGEAPLDTKVAGQWPTWPVAPEFLTPHGARAIAQLARHDRRWLNGAGCPAPGTVRIHTNTPERTIATGRAYADALAPGCNLTVEHNPEGKTDPLFEPLRAGATAFDATKAVAAITAYTGGVNALTARHAATIRELDRVLGCGLPAGCSTPGLATLKPSADGRGVDFTGPIRATSGTAQVILLQYAEGMPMRDVGFGRADAATIRRLGALHAALFDVFTRSPYMTAHQTGPVGDHMLRTLTAANGPRLEVLVGHDTNVTALAAALGVDLDAPGFARNDAAPGGALVLTRRWDARGPYVTVSYRVQPLDAIRKGTAKVIDRPISIPGCAKRCPLDRFDKLLRAKLAPVVAG